MQTEEWEKVDCRPVWAESEHCKSKVHCPTCRRYTGGDSWRQAIGRTFILPVIAQGSGFECPHGEPWSLFDNPSIAAIMTENAVRSIDVKGINKIFKMLKERDTGQ